ncbi:MAG TPA: hypothetical protein VFN42_07360 [Acetobacteraceae bacterium]|nr:hypothetical protein [Acetobacteraceae bacterium]
MRIVFLGLSLSSSWGNGHATTYRALLAGLAARGHAVTFLEREQPWYASNRDLRDPAYCRLEFYHAPEDLHGFAATLRAADAVIVGSYVPDAAAVMEVLCRSLGRPSVMADEGRAPRVMTGEGRAPRVMAGEGRPSTF